MLQHRIDLYREWLMPKNAAVPKAVYTLGLVREKYSEVFGP